MGGIVATSLLPSSNISAIITMSTPHVIPPARFDSRLDLVYKTSQDVLAHDPTPILSLCGGITDTMILSEFCVIPRQEDSTTSALRRTVFTSSLESCWTGVGHREMVWCHQVRWRIARATLELAHATSDSERREIIETCFRDGINDKIPRETSAFISQQAKSYEVLSEGKSLVVYRPMGSQIYILPITRYNSSFR